MTDSPNPNINQAPSTIRRPSETGVEQAHGGNGEEGDPGQKNPPPANPPEIPYEEEPHRQEPEKM